MILILIAALIGVLTVCPAFAQTTQAGTLNGGFSLGANGDARYVIPIDVPPGIGGMHPTLGLAYSSFAGNGQAGVGWQLTGGSAITRCKASPFFDGGWGTITNGSGDRFCIDGQRLINTSGDYGSAGAIYRTNLETWRYVQSSSTLCGSAPCSFTVTTKAGATWQYGTTGDSRVLAADGVNVRVWALAAVSDLSGNTVAFHYTQNPLGLTPDPQDHGYYLARIAYTSNGVFAANRAVAFSYGSRSDVTTAYEAATAITTRALLTNVTTSVGATVALDYRLSYGTSGVSGRSLLSAVRACAGSDASAQCVEPTTFTWQGADALSFTTSTLATKLPSTAGQVLPLDANGDGRGDLVYVSSSSGAITASPYLSTPAANGYELVACAGSLKAGDTSLPLLVADVNADGRSDLIQRVRSSGTESLIAYLADAGGCTFSQVMTSPRYRSGPDFLWPMDANGDGRGDIVLGWTSRGVVSIVPLLSGETAFSVGGSSTIALGVSGELRPGDANGDGMVDLIQTWTAADGTLALAAYLAGYLSDGTIVFGGGVNTSTTFPKQGTFLQVDVNSDGNVDLVQTWTSTTQRLATWISDGTGKFTLGGTTDTGRGVATSLGIWSLDLTGDHGSDLVQVWRDGSKLRLVVYRRSGAGRGLAYDNGTEIESTLAADYFDTTWPIDLDGDGRSDLLQGYPSGRGALALALYANSGAAVDLVSTAVDGLAGRTSIGYLPMADSRVYTESAPAYPSGSALGYAFRQTLAQAPYQVAGGGNLQLVARYTFSSTTKHAPYSYTYTAAYSGAAIDFTGLGWLGMGAKTVTNVATGMVATTRTNQTYPLTGTTASVTTVCIAATGSDPRCTGTAASPLTLSVSTTDYTSVQRSASATRPTTVVWEVLASSVRGDTYVYGTYDYSVGRSFAYDNFGNESLQSDHGYVDLAGKNLDTSDDLYTCTTYDNTVTPSGWIAGYPTAIKVSSRAACTDFDSFDKSADFSLEKLTYTSTRHLATQARWDSAHSAYLVTSYTYDAYGNALSRTEPGNRTTNYTVEPVYNTYRLTETAPPNQAGLRLTTTFGHDPRFGVLSAFTTPNDETYVYCLDSFGGHLATQSPIPDFVAVTPDANCVSPLTTGAVAQFAKASVVTVQATSTSRDAASGNTVLQVSDLETWSAGSTRQTTWHRVVYDGLGRPVQAVQQGVEASGNIAVCRYFDSNSAEVLQSLPSFIGASTTSDCARTANDGRLWIQSTYDVLSRLTRAVRPAGPTGSETSVTTIAFDTGDTQTITSASGDSYALTKVLTYRYAGSQHKVVSMVLPVDGNATTTYQYDRTGRLISLTDPATPSNPSGVTNSITWDSLDRRTCVANPDQNTSGGNAMCWSYDASTGLLVAATDGQWRITSYINDALGRPVTEARPDGTTYTFTYDDPSVANGLNHLTRVVATAPTTGAQLFRYDFAYDSLGEPATRTVTIGSRSFATTRWFDPQERVQQLFYPDGSVMASTWQAGNLVRTTLDGEVVGVYSSFTANGQAQKLAFGNGVTSALGFAPTGEQISFSVTDSTGKTIADRTFEWNHLGSVTAAVDNLKSVTDYTQQYELTNNRLTGAVSPGGLYEPTTFAYDASGNLTRAGDVTYSYSAHRLTGGKRGAETVLTTSYDASGNLTRKVAANDTWAFAYDSTNHLSTVTRNGETVLRVPVYDELGFRLERVDGDGVRSVYADPAYVLTEAPGESIVATKYVPGPLGILATVTTLVDGSATGTAGDGYPAVGTLYFSVDQVGSTTLTTDASGLLHSEFAYLPYGAMIAAASTGPDDVREKFTARELDESTGLYYFDSRYYDPSLGRFLTPDTELGSDLFTVDALNRYAYALNNPASFIDPTGHRVIDAFFGAVIGAAEVLAGVGVIVFSGGELTPLGDTLIGAGVGGINYSTTHVDNFSWKQYAIETGINAALGLALSGFGERPTTPGLPTERTPLLPGEEPVRDYGSVRDEAAPRTGARSARMASEEEVVDEEAEEVLGECTVSAASFAAGTAVLTEDGPRPIEEIAAGDRVWGFDREAGAAELFDVVASQPRHSDRLIRISGDGVVLEAGPRELIWISGRGWTRADEVSAGDQMVDVQGRRRPVRCVEDVVAPAQVVELEVEAPHTYFASADAVLVHNVKVGAKPTSCRKFALGATPSKNSRVGREVWERSVAEGTAKTIDGAKYALVQQVENGKWVWVELNEKIDMGHIHDAVAWWNQVGYKYGPRSKQAWAFMHDSTNYRFEWGPLNRANGARLRQVYRPPRGWGNKPWPPGGGG